MGAFGKRSLAALIAAAFAASGLPLSGAASDAEDGGSAADAGVEVEAVRASGEPPAPLDGISIDRMRLEEGAYRQRTEDGRVVTFTVDPDLQAFSERLLERYEVPAGAVVALSSRTGRVLALAQRRGSESASGSSSVALDPSPPAASLFKIVTAAALLEQGGVSLDTRTCFRGGSGGLAMRHLLEEPEGAPCAPLDLALGRSINAIFAKLSDRRLPPDALARWAERFLFNRELPFDLPVEPSRAEIPDDRLGRARAAAGFWHTHLSPLHAAAIAQSIAQRGAMLRPYVVEEVRDSSGRLVHECAPEMVGRPVSEETAGALLRAMTRTVARGTAQKSFRDHRGIPYLPDVTVAGKTGTLTGSSPYRAYSWFVAAAPAERPEIALSVLVVNEPKWRIKSAQAAALILRRYFDSRRG